MQRMGSPALKQLCNCNPFFQPAESGVHMGGGKLHYLRKIRAAVALYRFNALAEKTGAVFQAAAVLIGALIPDRGQELICQVTAVGVHFHRIGACVFG